MTYNVQCMCIHAQYIHECLFVCVRARVCVLCECYTYTEYLAAICSLTGISSLGRLGNMG